MTRVLLDEGAPKPLAKRLRALGVDATAFPNDGKQLSNGKLMDALEQLGLQVLITNDKNIPYQQNLSKRQVAVIVLATSNLRDVLALAPAIARGIASVEIGKSFLLTRSGDLTPYPIAQGKA